MTDPDHERTAQQLADALLAGESARILDIRDRTAVEQWRISGDTVEYTHVPRSKLLQAKALGTVDELVADIDGTGPITVVCAEGRASREVAQFLREAGFEAHNLSDGMEGWASVYRATPVTTDGEATVLQYDRPSSGCLSYLLVDGGDAVVVDPLAAFADRYAEDAAAHDATLSYALDTHVHADHLSGVTDVAAQTDATPIIPHGARERGSTVDAETIADGETLSVGSTTLTAVHAPGHTTEMTAYHCEGVLFVGDSLFVESVARPDLEAGAEGAEDLAGDLYETLHERFARFDDETVLAPGHHSETTARAEDGTYSATLGAVGESLGLLGLDRETFVERIVADMPPRPANFEEIIAINLGTESVTEADAFELELGPNNCAATAD